MSSDDDRCLQCGETRGAIKAGVRANGAHYCVTLTGYETVEIDQEWDRHRFRPWGNTALKTAGIAKHAYAKHRLSDIDALQWAACEDTIRGHAVLPYDEPDFGTVAGQCISCGKKNLTPNRPPREDATA
jgi:hypothetical protein